MPVQYPSVMLSPTATTVPVAVEVCTATASSHQSKLPPTVYAAPLWSSVWSPAAPPRSVQAFDSNASAWYDSGAFAEATWTLTATSWPSLTVSGVESLTASAPAGMVTDAAPAKVTATGAAARFDPELRMPAETWSMVSGAPPSALDSRTSTASPVTVERAMKRQE